MKCNICGSNQFEPMGNRPTAKCSKCHSLERTRLLWLHLERSNISKTSRVLHIAPEKGIYARLSTLIDPENYITADFDPGGYAFAAGIRKINLCDLDDWPSLDFDFIIHSHVLEHTPCNMAYTLWHLHRMLKSDGLHICVIPFMQGKYDECFQDIGGDERIRRFGQSDHVRRIGRDDLAAHLGTLLQIPHRYDATEFFDVSTLQDANIPDNCWQGYSPNTVLRLKRDDMKLIRTCV